MSKGKFGIHGGQFVPETLMNAVNEFEEAYEKYYMYIDILDNIVIDVYFNEENHPIACVDCASGRYFE